MAEFLASRRARITPQESGLPPAIGRRRVAGLRREEVALLAGVAVEYYAGLERGRVGAVSEGVLESLARVLHLDDAERAHLAELVRTTGGAASDSPGAPGDVRPELRDLVDLLPDAAAFVRNARLDVLAANPLARALYAHVFDTAAAGAPEAVPNLARSLFLDPRSRTFCRYWPRLADNAVGGPRAEAARSRATATWPTSSSSSASAARSSARAGPGTSSTTTAPATSTSVTSSSATSRCGTRPSTSSRTLG